MAFYLVKEHIVEFMYEPYIKNGDMVTRTSTVPVNIHPIEDCNTNVCEMVEEWIRETPRNSVPEAGNSPNDKGSTNKQLLQVTVGFDCSNSSHPGTRYEGLIKLAASRTGNKDFLERLQCKILARGLQLKLKILIKNLESTHETQPNIRQTIETIITEERDVEEFGNLKGVSSYVAGCYWSNSYWEAISSYNHKGIITILGSIVVPYSPNVANVNVTNDDFQFNINKKILEDEVGSDAEIIACNGEAIKCHKSFLAVQSPVLQAMFKEPFEESKTSSIEMPDMTVAGVKSFLAFLYCQVVQNAIDDCSIAIELLKAGHKYDIPSLEAKMKRVMLYQPDDWYNVEVALKLFMFARNLPDDEGLKLRAIKLLKLNFRTLKSSPAYKQIFKDEPSAAMELCEHAFSL